MDVVEVEEVIDSTDVVVVDVSDVADDALISVVVVCVEEVVDTEVIDIALVVDWVVMDGIDDSWDVVADRDDVMDDVVGPDVEDSDEVTVCIDVEDSSVVVVIDGAVEDDRVVALGAEVTGDSDAIDVTTVLEAIDALDTTVGADIELASVSVAVALVIGPGMFDVEITGWVDSDTIELGGWEASEVEMSTEDTGGGVFVTGGMLAEEDTVCAFAVVPLDARAKIAMKTTTVANAKRMFH